MREPVVETSIRIVKPGAGLWVCTRRALVTGTAIAPKDLERVCGRLRYERGLAAVPLGKDSLIVATSDPIPRLRLEGEDWEVSIEDAGEPIRHLTLQDPDGGVMPDLIERALCAQICRRTRRWTVDSPRIWYEAGPLDEQEGIAVYRRIAVGGVLIEGVGVGIAADVQTAFFTSEALDWFFDPTLPPAERRERQIRFDRLAQRQGGQRGTLLYDRGGRSKCWFAKSGDGLTCGQVPTRVRGQSYPTLLAYYHERYPGLAVTADTPVVYVTFPSISTVPVAANLVRLRVMNESLPRSLRDVDKVPPADRRDYVEHFWRELGHYPLGKVAPGVMPGFWRPDRSQVWRPALPTLRFGKEREMPGPRAGGHGDRANYHRRRMNLLRGGGCYSLPPTSPRTIHCAYPQGMEAEAPARFIDSLCALVSDWTGKVFEGTLVPYTCIEDGIEKLQDMDAGMVLFVLNEEPAAYYNVSYSLSGWRIKRVTQTRLCQSFTGLTMESWDHRAGSKSTEKGRRDWDRFVEMSALDVLQQLDAIPWCVEADMPFDAQLVIDVGHDRRYFAFALLITRRSDACPAFEVWTEVKQKLDIKSECINPEVLQNELMKFIKRRWPRRGQPLASLLVLRDGHLCECEIEAMEKARERLVAMGCLAPDARIEMAELHKETQLPVRIWEMDERGISGNITEPTAIRLTKHLAVFVGTTRVTLTQGTAEPVLFEARSGVEVRDVVDAYAPTTQLTWSNPGKEQTVALHVRRTDDDLVSRSQQEIKRTR